MGARPTNHNLVPGRHRDQGRGGLAARPLARVEAGCVKGVIGRRDRWLLMLSQQAGSRTNTSPPVMSPQRRAPQTVTTRFSAWMVAAAENPVLGGGRARPPAGSGPGCGAHPAGGMGVLSSTAPTTPTDRSVELDNPPIHRPGQARWHHRNRGLPQPRRPQGPGPHPGARTARARPALAAADRPDQRATVRDGENTASNKARGLIPARNDIQRRLGDGQDR